jgi:hypothetical protein
VNWTSLPHNKKADIVRGLGNHAVNLMVAPAMANSDRSELIAYPTVPTFLQPPPGDPRLRGLEVFVQFGRFLLLLHRNFLEGADLG